MASPTKARRLSPSEATTVPTDGPSETLRIERRELVAELPLNPWLGDQPAIPEAFRICGSYIDEQLAGVPAANRSREPICLEFTVYGIRYSATAEPTFEAATP
jgi:hypothetical protein